MDGVSQLAAYVPMVLQAVSPLQYSCCIVYADWWY